jgi:hypothetical protein
VISCANIAEYHQEPIAYFSINYQQAREKFLQACATIGAQLENYKLPGTYSQGKRLFTDVAYFGPRDAKKILVFCSGTHGVEGFAGSAIQTGLLQEGIVSQLGEDTGLLFIHALNPYGFAHLRRFNEDNIDLNRNFIDHSSPPPQNEGYAELADVIFPETISGWGEMKSQLRLLWYRLTKGKDALRCAISRGQYAYPKGLFYGGKSASWSNKTLKKIAEQFLSQADHVIFIDFHTGLGAFGAAEIIMNSPKSSQEYGRAVDCWGDIVRTTVTGEAVSCHIVGSLKLAVSKMLPNTKVTAVSLEFGTYSKRSVLLALRAENWLHHQDKKDVKNAEKIKAELLEAFYPNQPEWKLKIWQHGRNVVEQGLGCLSKEQAKQEY